MRIYATDGHGITPIHGAVNYPEGWSLTRWDKRGRRFELKLDNEDLIEVKPRIKRTVWLNLYESGVVLSEEKPNVAKMFDNRLACVKVEIDCEEGEGL